ncbi:ATP-dependent endonuclease, partial [Kosakonia sp. MH5]|nr:ATP-dependent endonuclease [Kosakonia sp. MH5]
AILLGKKVDPYTAIPRYILDAIAFAQKKKKKEVWFNILSYRMNFIEEDDPFVNPKTLAEFRTKLQLFKNGDIDFVGIKNEMFADFPDDRINDVLEVF